MTSRSRTFIMALVFITAIAAIPACDAFQSSGVGITPEQVTLIEQQLQQSRQDVAALPADDPGRIEAETKIAELEQLVATYKINRERQEAGDPEASIAAGVQTVAPFLPPPWNAALLIAGGLIPGVAGWIRESIRRNQAQRAGQDLARAIKSAAVANGGVLDFTDLTVRESLKSAMPDAARAIVKDAGANVPLPFAPGSTGSPGGSPRSTPAAVATPA